MNPERGRKHYGVVYDAYTNHFISEREPRKGTETITNRLGPDMSYEISEREPRKGTETWKNHFFSFFVSLFQNVNPERGRKPDRLKVTPQQLGFQNVNPERGRKPADFGFNVQFAQLFQNVNPERGRKPRTVDRSTLSMIYFRT